MVLVVSNYQVAAENCCSEKSRFSPKAVRTGAAANQNEGLGNSKPKRNLTRSTNLDFTSKSTFSCALSLAPSPSPLPFCGYCAFLNTHCPEGLSHRQYAGTYCFAQRALPGCRTSVLEQDLHGTHFPDIDAHWTQWTRTIVPLST